MVWQLWLLSQYFGGRGQPELCNTPNSKCANKKKDSKSRSWASLLSCGIQDMAPLAKARNAVCQVLHKDVCQCPSCGRTIVRSPAPPGFSDKRPMESRTGISSAFSCVLGSNFLQFTFFTILFSLPCIKFNDQYVIGRLLTVSTICL